MSTASTTKMTARQFDRLGDDPPGLRLELVDGEIAVSPSPRLGHSNVDRELTALLTTYFRANDLGKLFGDVDTILNEFNVRRPDLFYFSKARLALLDFDNPNDVIPELCVEIISPSSGSIDRRDKFQQYARAGVNHYWVIDPDAKTIEAFTLIDGQYQSVASGSDDDLMHLPPFPELAIPLSNLWLPGGSP
jgi:Uma2 family endonuclease